MHGAVTVLLQQWRLAVEEYVIPSICISNDYKTLALHYQSITALQSLLQLVIKGETLHQ